MSASTTNRPHSRTASSRTWLRVAIALCIGTTVTVLFWRTPLAWVPAALAAVIYCMDVLILTIDRRARLATRLSADERTAEQRSEAVEREEWRVGTSTALVILGALAAIAIVIAAALFEWTLVAIAALAIFAWLVFLGMPFWLAAVEEEVETKHDKLTGTSRSIH